MKIGNMKPSILLIAVVSSARPLAVMAGLDCDVSCGTDFLGRTQYWITKEDDLDPCNVNPDDVYCTAVPELYGLFSKFECVEFCTKALQHFEPGELELDPPVNRRLEISKELKGKLDGPFVEISEPYLTAEEIDRLKKFADSSLKQAIAKGVEPDKDDTYFTDYIAKMTPSELLSMVSPSTVKAMYDEFKRFNPLFPVSRVHVRRTNAPEQSKFIPYHTDGPSTVMHVWMNSEEDLDGGLYLFLTPDGSHKIPNTPGAAIVHGDEVMHGVASFKGIRYTFLMVGDSVKHNDILAKDLGYTSTTDL